MFLMFLIGLMFLLILFLIFIALSPGDFPDDAVPMSFKSFKQFYLINPNRWVLNKNSIDCIVQHENKWHFEDKRHFYFGWLDYQKYKRFYNKIQQDKINERDMRATAEMLNAVKKDIANMENLAQQQKKQAVDNLESILKNL